MIPDAYYSKIKTQLL